jgi:cellulose/xylan binding protein with CBM9 domain
MRAYRVAPFLLLGLWLCGFVAPPPSGSLQKPPAPVAVEQQPTICPFTKEPITIDGKLDEPAWQRAAQPELVVFWAGRAAKTKTKARLLWGDDALYFAAEMEDVDLYADIREHNGMCWLNDVFELFFKPSEKSLAYYEFQVNAAGTHLEMFLPSRGAGGYGRFGKKDVKLGMVTAVKLDGTLNQWQDEDKGWTVEGKIPWTAFAATGGKPKPGDVWRYSLCRYDYSVKFERAETSSTSHLTQGDFHRYEEYLKLKFAAPGE